MKGPLYALFLVSAAFACQPVQANVYKCTINGETRYQDEPCPGDRDAAPHLEFAPDPKPEPEPALESSPESEPQASDQTRTPRANGAASEARSDARREGSRVARDRDPPSAPPPDDDSPLDRPAQLGVDIAAAEKELRAIVDERRDTLGAIDVRLAAGGNPVALQAERKRRDAIFRERRLEVSSRLARLKAELAEVCPNGTFQNVHRLACR